MFSGPGASVDYNEVGEPIGWDYPSFDAPEDEGDFYDDYDYPDEEYDDPMDGDHASALASAGFGTDEDYGYFGDSDFFGEE